MLGNRLPEGGFEDERSVRRFLYSPLDLCMLEEQGVEEGLEDSIVWWSRPCTGGGDIARMAATQREILPCSSPTT